jgi:hypothetical protein
VQHDAAEPFMKGGVAAEPTQERRLDELAGAIETIAQAPAQPADAVTFGCLGKYRLRI